MSATDAALRDWKKQQRRSALLVLPKEKLVNLLLEARQTIHRRNQIIRDLKEDIKRVPY